MVRKYQAGKIVFNAKDEILDLHNKRYSLLEIYETIPDLKDKISYSSLARICSDLNLFEKNEKRKNQDSTKSQNFVNEKKSPDKADRMPTNAEKNLEALKARPETFKFDHGTNDSELI